MLLKGGDFTNNLEIQRYLIPKLVNQNFIMESPPCHIQFCMGNIIRVYMKVLSEAL